MSVGAKRSTPWEVREAVIPGVFSVGHLDDFGRRVTVYDNWYSMTLPQAQAVCAALNTLEGYAPPESG